MSLIRLLDVENANWIWFEGADFYPANEPADSFADPLFHVLEQQDLLSSSDLMHLKDDALFGCDMDSFCANAGETAEIPADASAGSDTDESSSSSVHSFSNSGTVDAFLSTAVDSDCSQDVPEPSASAEHSDAAGIASILPNMLRTFIDANAPVYESVLIRKHNSTIQDAQFILPKSAVGEAERVPPDFYFAFAVNRQAILLGHSDCINVFNLPANFSFWEVTKIDSTLERFFTKENRDIRGVPTIDALCDKSVRKYMLRFSTKAQTLRLKYCAFVYRYRLLESILRGHLRQFVEYLYASTTVFDTRGAFDRFKRTLCPTNLNFAAAGVLSALLAFDPACPSTLHVLSSCGGFTSYLNKAARRTAKFLLARATGQHPRKRKRDSSFSECPIEDNKRVKVEDDGDSGSDEIVPVARKLFQPIRVNLSLSATIKYEQHRREEEEEQVNKKPGAELLKMQNTALKLQQEIALFSKLKQEIAETIQSSKRVKQAAKDACDKIDQLFAK